MALTLLQLRDASRHPASATTPAKKLLALEYVEVLSQWRYGRKVDMTLREFYLALGRLGGHQNRRHDPDPGWLVLWRGWTKLQLLVTGYQAGRRKCG